MVSRREAAAKRRVIALRHRPLVTLAALALVIAGCGDEPTTPREESADQPRTITLTDQRGAVIRLDAHARRIVTIPMPAASMLIALDGSADRLAAMHAGSAAAIRKEILGEFFPKAASLPSDIATESFAPNVESITKVKPDLVVQWGDRGSEVIAPLENAGGSRSLVSSTGPRRTWRPGSACSERPLVNRSAPRLSWTGSTEPWAT